MRPVTHMDPITGRVQRRGVSRRPIGACQKFAYASRKAAYASARTQSRMTGENIQAYHCFACHCYHIGHPSGSRRHAG